MDGTEIRREPESTVHSVHTSVGHNPIPLGLSVAPRSLVMQSLLYLASGSREPELPVLPWGGVRES